MSQSRIQLYEVSALRRRLKSGIMGADGQMRYRIMQIAVSVLGIVFALMACRAVNEPWRQMNSVMATQIAAGYLIAAILAIICIVVAQRFGVKARQMRDTS
jgi:hypothetical protein